MKNNSPHNRELQYEKKIMNNNFTPIKPRSMIRVLSDIEYCITNEVKGEIIETDILQLIAQLMSLKNNLEDGGKCYKILNPTLNYYDRLL